MKRAHTLQDVVDAGYAPSVRWLKDRLRSGEIPGFRIGRRGQRGGGHYEWRMTDDDIDAFIESRRNQHIQPRLAPTLNLTPAARRRRAS